MNMIVRAIVLKIVVLAVILIMGSREMQAQYDAMFTQYMHNEMFINPAYTGSREALQFTFLDRQQWIGFPGRPITRTFSMNAPMFQNKMGLGLSFLNEQIGELNRNLVYLSYSYRIRVSERGRLAFGLMGGVHMQSLRLSQVNTVDPGDPQFMADINNIGTPNFGYGMYYYTDNFYAGLSIPRMVDDNLVLSNSGEVLKHLVIKPTKFHYYFTIGQVFRSSPSLLWKPQVMMKMVMNAPVEFDFNLSALIDELIWVGLAYRTRSDLSGIIGIQISPQFLLSYAYDYPLTELQTFTSGSHEIVISYLFSYKGQKIVSPRYF